MFTVTLHAYDRTNAITVGAMRECSFPNLLTYALDDLKMFVNSFLETLTYL